jgi:hypothetical protein
VQQQQKGLGHVLWWVNMINQNAGGACSYGGVAVMNSVINPAADGGTLVVGAPGRRRYSDRARHCNQSCDLRLTTWHELY